MRAQVIESFGDSRVFVPQNLNKPVAQAGQLLIRVKATSVNPIDYKIRSGDARALAPDFPAILHGDFAGIVEAKGPGTVAFEVGDEVYGCGGGVKGASGALAEYMVVDAKLAAHKPESLNMLQAAALPLVSLTAWEALVEKAQLQKGQKVLVFGSTGGVGHVGVQLAKSLGAKVYATVSSDEKALLARDLGADVVIPHTGDDLETFVREEMSGLGFDVVFDTVGGKNIERSFRVTRPYGQVVTILALTSCDLNMVHARSLSLHSVFMLIPLLLDIERERHGEILQRITRLVEGGQLKPLLDSRTFSLDTIASAHEWAQSGRQIGKVTVEI